MTNTAILALALGVAISHASPLPLRVSMISLAVRDTARSSKFYGETLGLQLIGKPGEVTFFRAGEITIVLNGPAGKAARNQIAGATEVIFPVESVASAYDTLTQRGCHFVAAPHEVTPGSWAATFTDPDGHLLTTMGPR